MNYEAPLYVEAAPKIDVAAALKELKQKTDSQIERETSLKWAARSIAAYQLFEETGKVDWLLKGYQYFHEALEHGALANDDSKTLNFVERAVHKVSKKIIPENLPEE